MFSRAAIIDHLTSPRRRDAVHCPDRHDYGFRYLQSDLPTDVYEALQPLVYVGDASEIPARVAEGTAMFESTLELWDGRVGLPAARPPR